MYTRLVAMHVTDPTAYAAYRAAMAPILSEYGGGFAYDVVTEQATGVEHPVTRVFAITFRDEQACTDFFADARYAAVRAAHFVGAVGRYTELAAYSSTP